LRTEQHDGVEHHHGDQHRSSRELRGGGDDHGVGDEHQGESGDRAADVEVQASPAEGSGQRRRHETNRLRQQRPGVRGRDGEQTAAHEHSGEPEQPAAAARHRPLGGSAGRQTHDAGSDVGAQRTVNAHLR
jgi:hypothetical protein